MFTSLSPGAIGIRGLGLIDALALARPSGFTGIEVPMREAAQIAATQGITHLRGLFAQAGVRPGSWSLPFSWQDEAQWRAGVAELPALAEVARQLDCTRVSTWVPPGSNDRPMAENRRWHVERFRPIADALAPSGCRIGLEFIGPPTSRAAFTYPFVYSIGGMLEVIDEIGAPNVGLLVDAWHVYTSGDTNADVAALRPDQAVVVHVNDAPPGLAIDQQDDHVRRLPLDSGIIDLRGFMGALQSIGYDGPVIAEPFDATLNALAAHDPGAAATRTAASLTALWRLLG